MARRASRVNVSIVGAGRVGTALAMLFRSKGFRVVSVTSHRKSSARKVARLAGCRRYSVRLSDIHPETNFLLLAIPDEEVGNTARQIAHSAPVNFRRVYCAHTSGVLTSDELRPLARLGAATFSLHPIQSFPGKLSRRQQLGALEGISYGVEGSVKAVQFAKRIVSRIGGKMFRVPKEVKILYHLACVFASNYSVSVLGMVEELGKSVSKSPLTTHLQKLVESSIRSAFRTSPRQALTGPITRGDVATVRRHLAQLRGTHKHLKNAYNILGQYALTLAKHDKRLRPKQIRRMKTALET